MNLNSINFKIGYWPYKENMEAPGDRRRFVFYANERNIIFSKADINKEYDIVYLTYGCNISQWIAYKKRNPNVRVIFELVDSYIFESPSFTLCMRGIVKFASRKESKLFLNYKKGLLKLISIADTLVCSTEEQKSFLSQYNNNIHISLDYFSEDITVKKTSYATSGKLKLVWEGQAYTVQNLLVINNAFKKLKDEIELHVITDPKTIYPFKIFDKTIQQLLKKLSCNWVFHEWKKETFSEIIASADLAIIPISDKSGMMWHKPSNKLLLLWEIGIPVLTTDTPAYVDVMEKSGLFLFCKSNEEWVEQILKFKNYKEEERKNIYSTAQKYLDKEHNKVRLLEKWDQIFMTTMNNTYSINY